MNNLNWRPFAVLAVLITALFAIAFTVMMFFVANPATGWSSMWWGMGGMGFFWIFPLFGFAMMLLMMLFFVSIFAGRGSPMDWMFGNWSRDTQTRPPFSAGGHESPLDIVKARYARGEINKEQFDAMRRELGL